MACDDCKEDRLTFSFFQGEMEPKQVESRYSPTPDLVNLDPCWVKLCVDCIGKRREGR